MFKKAVLTLTLWYMLIIMGLSLGFSLALYQVSSKELSASEMRQEMALRRNMYIPFDTQRPIIDEAQKGLNESLETIAWNLFYFNLLILIAGSAVSYFLAKRTLQPIQEATESQNRFTADASHELRTPLTAMRTELEVSLRDPALTLKESKALHQSTLEEIAKLESLSNALLRLSHHDQDAARARFTSCSLEEVVKDAKEKVAKPAAAKHITITADEIRGSVPGDHWSLVELFAVILDNAVKYSPEKTAVTIEGHLADKKAVVSIRDEGRGIGADDLPHIFDRFYQSDMARTKTADSGYGLGLSIAKKIIDLHQGGIEVRSSLGHGTTFTVSLPTR